MEKGWILLHRKLLSSDLWEDKPFTKGQAWIDILLTVNYEDNDVEIDGKTVKVKRGWLIFSERHLMRRWGWGNTKVRNFIQQLETQNMIKTCKIQSAKQSARQSALKVLKYSLYQQPQSTTQSAKQSETKEIYINNIYIAWQKCAIIQHKKLTDTAKKLISKRLNEFSEQEIIQAINNYSTALKDADYAICAYKWSLDEFMQRDKGMPAFVNSGYKWINYLECKHSKGGGEIGHSRYREE